MLKDFAGKLLDCGGIWAQYLLHDAVVLTQDALTDQLHPQWYHDAYILLWIHRTGFQQSSLTSQSHNPPCAQAAAKAQTEQLCTYCLTLKEKCNFMVFLDLSSWQVGAFFLEDMSHVAVAMRGALLFHSDPGKMPWNTGEIEYDFSKHMSLWIFPSS